MHVHLPFDYKKATQALNFFARRSGGRINKMKVIKLIFFADRYHLRKYGRLITNGEYYAMGHGPVNSGVKDIAEMSAFLDESEKSYAARYIGPTDKYAVRSRGDVDRAIFSETDLEALEFAWKKFGHLKSFQLRDLTHHYPEWKRYEQVLQWQSRTLIEYGDFLDDPARGLDACHELTPADKQDRLDQLREAAEINALWS